MEGVVPFAGITYSRNSRVYYKPSYLTIKSNCSHVECVKLSNYLFFEGNCSVKSELQTVISICILLIPFLQKLKSKFYRFG